jgi:hypothetical protein
MSIFVCGSVCCEPFFTSIPFVRQPSMVRIEKATNKERDQESINQSISVLSSRPSTQALYLSTGNLLLSLVTCIRSFSEEQFSNPNIRNENGRSKKENCRRAVAYFNTLFQGCILSDRDVVGSTQALSSWSTSRKSLSNTNHSRDSGPSTWQSTWVLVPNLS